MSEDINRIVYLTNPLSEDYTFRWDKTPYVVPAQGTVPMAYFLARHGMKHLTDYIILHPKFWPELKIVRDDWGDKRNSDGQVVNDPDTTKGREEIEKMLFSETAPMQAKYSTMQGEVFPPKPNKTKSSQVEKEFPDLPK